MERSRRESLARVGAGLALAGVPGTWIPAAAEEPRRARRVEKEVFIPSKGGRGVFPGFVSYIHPKDPVLLHRFGWGVASDT